MEIFYEKLPIVFPSEYLNHKNLRLGKFVFGDNFPNFFCLSTESKSLSITELILLKNSHIY